MLAQGRLQAVRLAYGLSLTRLVAVFSEPGKAVATNCVTEYYWRRKLKLAAAVGDGGGAPANKFVALHVIDAAVGAATGLCILVLRSGLRLELAALPSPAWLLALEQVHAGVR